MEDLVPWDVEKINCTNSGPIHILLHTEKAPYRQGVEEGCEVSNVHAENFISKNVMMVAK